MPKTAEEWKDQLELDYLPDDELLEALNGLEGKEVIGSAGPLDSAAKTSPTDPPTFVAMTFDEFKEALLVESVGLAFKSIRKSQGYTTRTAAQRYHLSQGRVSQIEQPGVNLELATIADLARRMGYRTRVVFEPVEGGTPISALVDVKR
jgi:DNA-binding XRE family transcriptional regulator